MNFSDLPADLAGRLIPKPAGKMAYRCLSCDAVHGIGELLYTCPRCGGVLLLEDAAFGDLKRTPSEMWRRIFDYRRLLNVPALKGIYRFHELLGPVIPLDSVVYLGEGGTPLVEAAQVLQEEAGIRFLYKNDGQNPSASFKDRGMASAVSYINFLIRSGRAGEILAVCASTGDTSASAALYASYLHPKVKSAVLLPHGKVTPEQLSQPLGSGARVFEIPGVFDDCMKVVERLAETYEVALLNSKNAWRILGQESYSYEIAQDFDWNVQDLAVFVPIGNAGNITAVMAGFLKLHDLGVIETLPKIVGVQSHHADPVFRYYEEPDPSLRRFVPVTVKPSAAQAAMIGNPVSMPRVIRLAEIYDERSGGRNVFVVRVTEQGIMDGMLSVNRRGHVACTQGGECYAGMRAALREGVVSDKDTAILDATAHAIKFSAFQNMYFSDSFPPEFGVAAKPELKNHPCLVRPDDLALVPAPGKPLSGDALLEFIAKTSRDVAGALGLNPRKPAA